MMVETPVSKALVRRAVADYFAAIRALDAEAWVATFDAQAARFGPDGTPCEGHVELRALLETMREQVEWISIREDLVLVSGDGAAVKWSGHWKPRNSAEVDIQGIEVFEVGPDGKIRTVWAYREAAAMVTGGAAAR